MQYIVFTNLLKTTLSPLLEYVLISDIVKIDVYYYNMLYNNNNNNNNILRYNVL
jgi:hypothetical protein